MKARAWLILLLCGLAGMLFYIDRQTLSVLKTSLKFALGWSDVDYGWLVNAFMGCYTVGFLFAGRWVDRWGTRRMMPLFFGLMSLSTVGCAYAHRLGEMAACRALLGFAEAGIVPAVLVAIFQWFPETRRGFATTLKEPLNVAGQIIVTPMAIVFSAQWGWQSAFLVPGIAGLALAVAWYGIDRGGTRNLPQTAAGPILPPDRDTCILPQAAANPIPPPARDPHILPQAATGPILPQARDTDILPQAAASPILPQARDTHILPQAAASPILPQARDTRILPQAAASPILPQARGSGILPLSLPAAPEGRPPLPSYRAALHRKEIWGVIAARMISDPVWFFFLYWEPGFLQERIGLSVGELGRIGWIPTAVATVSLIVFGVWSDRLIVRRGWAPARSRRLLLQGVSVLAPVMLALPAVHNHALAIGLLCVARVMMLGWLSLSTLFMADLVPQPLIGTSVALMSAFGAAMSLACNTLVGPAIARFGYGPIFYVGAAAYPLAAVILWRCYGRNGNGGHVPVGAGPPVPVGS